MGGQIYFGNDIQRQWIPAPAINVGASKVGWASQTQLLNGGLYITQSATSHKEYDMSWNLASRDSIRAITDYADGVYGTGLAIYWADPFVMDKNALPQYVATPYLNTIDGPLTFAGRPTQTAYASSPLRTPTSGALWNIPDGSGFELGHILVPPGFSAWYMFMGAATNVQLSYLEFGVGNGVMSFNSVSASSFTWTEFSNAGSYDLVSISAKNLSGDTGTFELRAAMVQVLPIGVTPNDTVFISGQGNGGCFFAQQPQLTQYNAVLDKVGLSVKLVEGAPWQ